MDVIKYQVCSSEVAFTVSVFCSLVQTVAMFARILPASSVSLTWPEGREIYIYKKKRLNHQLINAERTCVCALGQKAGGYAKEYVVGMPICHDCESWGGASLKKTAMRRNIEQMKTYLSY